MPGIDLTDWVRSVMEALGYPGIGLLIILETVFPPIPSEIILPLGGFLASQGDFHVLGLILAATTGSVLGALILYAAGRIFNLSRLQYLFDRYGRYALLGSDDLDRAVDWFQRYGHWAVLIGRCVPIVRSLVSIPAGLAEMPVFRFVVLTAAGSAVWNTGLIGAGWVLGSQWEDAAEYTDVFEYIVLAAILIAVGWFVVKRLQLRSSE